MSFCLVITPDLSSGGMVRRLLKKQGRSNARVFACFEDFTIGPLVPTREPEQLLRIRHRFWRRNVGTDLVGLDPLNRLKPQPPLRKIISSADQIEVFVGGSGREQLFLLGLADVIQVAVGDPAKVQVFQYPSDGPSHSLGMLNLDALEDHPNPVELSRKLLGDLQEIWSLICKSTPHRIFDLHGKGLQMPEFQYLDRAIADLISSYPDLKTGLGLAEERLLALLTTEWTKSARAIGNAMIGDGNGRSFGDGILFSRVVQMADPQQPAPAIELRGDKRGMRSCEIRITTFGKACLAGGENFVAKNGIDTWIGGVHLNSSSGDVWYRGPQNSLSAS